MQPARAGAERNERAAPRRRKRLLHEELRPFLFTSHLNFLEMFYSELRQLLQFSQSKAPVQTFSRDYTAGWGGARCE